MLPRANKRNTAHPLHIAHTSTLPGLKVQVNKKALDCKHHLKISECCWGLTCAMRLHRAPTRFPALILCACAPGSSAVTAHESL